MGGLPRVLVALEEDTRPILGNRLGRTRDGMVFLGMAAPPNPTDEIPAHGRVIAIDPDREADYLLAEEIHAMARAGEELLVLDLPPRLKDPDGLVNIGIESARIAFRRDGSLRSADVITNFLGLAMRPGPSEIVLVNIATGAYRTVPELPFVIKEPGAPKYSLGSDGTLVMTFEEGELVGTLFAADLKTQLAFVAGDLDPNTFWHRGDSLIADSAWRYTGFAATYGRVHTITLCAEHRHPRLLPFTVEWEEADSPLWRKPTATPRVPIDLVELPKGAEIVFKGRGFCGDQVSYLDRRTGRFVVVPVTHLPSLKVWAGME
jgi:hypothetical protein